MSAGADTMVSSFMSFILGMTLHPESQKRAQAEIDRVIGAQRLPTLSDRPNLPYVTCIVKEVLRLEISISTRMVLFRISSYLRVVGSMRAPWVRVPACHPMKVRL